MERGRPARFETNFKRPRPLDELRGTGRAPYEIGMAMKIERGRAIIRSLLRKKGKHMDETNSVKGAEQEVEQLPVEAPVTSEVPVESAPPAAAVEPVTPVAVGAHDKKEAAPAVEPAQAAESETPAPRESAAREAPAREASAPRQQQRSQQGGDRRSYNNQPQRQRGSERRRVGSARELLLEVIRQRAQGVEMKLRTQLTGTILIDIVGQNRQRYLFDWSTDALKIAESDSDTGDCIMTLSEQSLLRIASGDLNPQIAMLSDKINVRGKLSLAIYFFNLVVAGAHGDGSRGQDLSAA